MQISACYSKLFLITNDSATIKKHLKKRKDQKILDPEGTMFPVRLGNLFWDGPPKMVFKCKLNPNENQSS